MSDFRLKKITLRNWNRIKSADIEFPEKGLVLVTGANMTANGKFQSIGSGKTSLGEAMARILCGVRGRFTDLGNFCNNTQPAKNLYVKIAADMLGSDFEVEAGYKCEEVSKSGEGLKFSWKGDPISRSHVDLTKKELAQTLKINPLLAQWSVFIDGDNLKFNKLSQEDAVALAMSALAQPPWATYRERSGSALDKSNRLEIEDQATLSNLRLSLTQMEVNRERAKTNYQEALDDFTRQLASRDEKKREVEETLQEAVSTRDDSVKTCEKLKNTIAELQNQSTQQFKALESNRLVLKDQLRALRDEHQTHTSAHVKINAATTAKQETLDREKRRLKAGVCPTCERSLDVDFLVKHISLLESEVLQLRESAQAATGTANATRKRLDAADTDLENLESKLTELQSLQKIRQLSRDYEIEHTSLERIERALNRLKEDLIDASKEPDKSRVNKCEAAVTLYSDEVTAAAVKIEAAAHSLQLAQETTRAVEYWHRAFGPAGIPNLVLESAVEPLNEAARRLAWLLSGSALQVRFETAKKLMSGETRAALTVSVKNSAGSCRLEGNSKGEGGLDNLIVAEALSEVGGVSKRMGWAWYDEVLSNQETVVKRNFIKYLKEKSERLGILIFIVDHGTEAAAFADYILEARKTADNTEFIWK